MISAHIMQNLGKDNVLLSFYLCFLPSMDSFNRAATLGLAAGFKAGHCGRESNDVGHRAARAKPSA
jgi:hypothetical protein